MSAFPDIPLDLDIELLLNGTWTDVSAYNEHGPIAIGRGHPDESTTVSASTLAATLTNNDGRFSSKNPVSPYYPYLVRNTACRVSIPAQQDYLRSETDNQSGAACPDAAPLRITGDLDVRADVRLTDSRYADLVQNWGASAGTYSWAFGLTSFNSGLLFFSWSPDGTTILNADSTVPVPAGRLALRVTLQVATGTVTFWTGPAGGADGSTWTQLGQAVVSGATSLHAGTNGVAVGAGLSPPGFYGNAYEAEVRSGIGGTVVAHPVFSAQAAGATSFADAQGNTWTLQGTAEISSRSYRIHAEIPQWPQHEAPGGKSVTVAASGGGLLRRYSQRNNPVNSVMYRAWTRVTRSVLAAYWPMEDGQNATRFGSASGGQAMYFGGSALPQLASSSAFACSSPLPVVNGSVFSGAVPQQHTFPWSDNQVPFLLQVPAGGDTNGAAIISVSTTGTVKTLMLSYFTGGSLTLQGFDAAGTQLFTSGTLAFNVNGQALLAAIALQNAGGGNLTWSIQTLAPGASSALSSTGTVSGTVGAVTGVQFNPYGSLGLLSTVLGHSAVLTQWQSLFSLDGYVNPFGLTTGALSAWTGEPAGVRFARLCAEEGIQCRIRGNLNATQLMGPQTAQTLQQLLQECADADRGIWYELRQQLGWGYVTRQALYNQAAQVTADYAQDHLAPWSPDPLEDDKDPVNDVTVTQSSGGSSSRQFAAPGQPVTGGRLSAQAPPNGVGTYDQAYTVNLYSAADLDNEAGWILHLGTVDQPRYPGIVLDLTNRDLASQFWAILDMELGDRIVADNPPAWLGPDPVSQLAQQVTETLWTKQLTVTVCAVPEQPYQVAADGAGFKVDTDGSTVHAGITSSATSMQVDTASGFPLWVTGAVNFDINAGGERMTVTNITGSSSPQTFAVTRSVNGMVKAQSSGTPVALWNTPVAAL